MLDFLLIFSLSPKNQAKSLTEKLNGSELAKNLYIVEPEGQEL